MWGCFFIDYSSAFNTIVPHTLHKKLLNLRLPPPTCTWTLDFLTNRKQAVKIGPHLSSTITVSTGAPQGCLLSPLLYSLYTHDCTSSHPSTAIFKFADDTAVVGLITGWQVSLQRWSAATDWVVRNEQSCAKYLQNKRAHTGLQEEEGSRSTTHLHKLRPSGESALF